MGNKSKNNYTETLNLLNFALVKQEKMKKVHYLLGITAMLFAFSCSSTYHAGNTGADDVYYSSKDKQPQQVQPAAPEPAPVSSDNYSNNNSNYSQDNSGQNQSKENSGQSQSSDYSGQNQTYDNSGNSNASSSQYSDSKGNTYVTNNYYDDNYDYEYSSRIRRFYTPAYGYGYYDPFYTNSYWYDYNPINWGVSIYLGYNWWAPSFYYYQPFCYGGGWSVGIGYGYGNYGYNPYGGGYPYYPSFSPGYGYGHGYNNGYNNGYWNGYNDAYYGGNTNPYYYNSYDATSHYYGPRGSVSSNSQRSSAQRKSELAPMSVKYERAISEGRISKSNNVSRADEMIQRAGSLKDKDIKQSSPQNSRTNSDLKDNSGINNNTVRQDNNNIKNQQNGDGRSIIKDNSTDGRAIKQDNNGNRQDNNGNRNTDMKTPTTQGKRQEPVMDNRNMNSGRNNNNSPRPSANPENVRPNFDKQNRTISTPSDNRQKINERQMLIQKNENNIQRENSIQQKDESDFSTTPSRSENKTPVFQPRNEPKQYKSESQPTPQRNSEPSRPSEQRNNNNNSGGRRR